MNPRRAEEPSAISIDALIVAKSVSLAPFSEVSHKASPRAAHASQRARGIAVTEALTT